MVEIIFGHSLFGPCKAYTYTVEWQKRGLPHAHLLFWLNERIRPELVDSIICAGLPDPEEDRELYDIISRNMIHGPCGLGYGPVDAQPCHNLKGRCTSRYPRSFRNHTQLGEVGYPSYRRRSPDDGGIFLQKDGRMIDNQWVVPHNRVLSKMFDAHINVELCHSVKSIKYISKYINKGNDRAIIEIESSASKVEHEIHSYREGRYLSSGEAMWRIFNFDIHQRHPAIQHLQVHLNGGQRIYFREDDNREQLANRLPPRTTLTAFFELCQVVDFARSLLYAEVSTYYTWNCSSKKPTSPDG